MSEKYSLIWLKVGVFIAALMGVKLHGQLVLVPSAPLSKEQTKTVSGTVIRIGARDFRVVSEDELKKKTVRILKGYVLPRSRMKEVALEEACEYLTVSVRDLYSQLEEWSVPFEIWCDDEIKRRKVTLVGDELTLESMIASLAKQGNAVVIIVGSKIMLVGRKSSGASE